MNSRGFTLVEVLLGSAIMTIVVVALLGAFFGQTFLNTNARNLTAAMNDATRVMEEIRRQNTGCQIPTVLPPNNTSWNAWLEGVGGGKTVNRVLPAANRNASELVVVTCQDEDGGTANADFCGTRAIGPNPAQVGTNEWRVQANVNTTFNPIRVTVAVGWTQDQRTMGGTVNGQEFRVARSFRAPLWDDLLMQTAEAAGAAPPGPPPGTLMWNDIDNDGVIESQAMLTTLVTCR